MSQTKTIPIAIHSEGDNMPDIQTITSQVQQLEVSSSLWSRISLWLIAGTAIIASLYFIAA